MLSSARVVASANLVLNYTNTTVGMVLKNEIDNHADTSCAGLNWNKLLEFVGRILQHDTLSIGYQPKSNKPVAKCATAVYTCPESGQSVLLVADQVLWLGPTSIARC